MKQQLFISPSPFLLHKHFELWGVFLLFFSGIFPSLFCISVFLSVDPGICYKCRFLEPYQTHRTKESEGRAQEPVF